MVACSFCDDRQFAFRPLCDDNKNNNNNMNICLRFFHGEAMAQLGNRALLHDLRVADSSPAWQLLTFCHNVFFSSYKSSMSTFKSSSQVPH